jgi:hypothetical protein
MLYLKAPGRTQFFLRVSNVFRNRVHHEVKYIVNAIFSKLISPQSHCYLISLPLHSYRQGFLTLSISFKKVENLHQHGIRNYVALSQKYI